MKIRMRDSGDVIIDDEFRARHSDTSFPLNLTSDLLDSFGADEVHETPYPEVTETQYVAFVGVEQIDGKWFTKYEARDLSADEIEKRLKRKRETMVVTPFQAKAALLNAGLLSNVEAVVNAAETPAIVKLAWSNAIEFRRTSPTIAQLAVSLNLTDEQLDTLFIDASKIKA